MSHCELSIQFEREPPLYAPGEPIRGNVLVRVDRDVTCSGLVIEHFWRAEGAGVAEHGVVQSQNIYAGEVRAESETAATFEILAPSGPPTYHGKQLKIAHCVRARLDIPWNLDPTAESAYSLAPDSEHYPQLPVLRNTESQASGLLRMLTLCLGLAFLAVGWLAPWPVGLFLWPLAGLAFFVVIRPWLTEFRAGKFRLETPVRTATPGQELEVELRFTPPVACVIDTAQLRLRCREITRREDGSESEQLVVNTLRNFSVESPDIQPKQSVVLRTLIPIPETDAYSFEGASHEVRWELEVNIDVFDWAEWKQTVPLIVRGNAASSSAPDVAV